jgi:hypothetical protein
MLTLHACAAGYARSAAQRVGLWDGSDTLSKDDLLNYLRLLGHVSDHPSASQV